MLFYGSGIIMRFIARIENGSVGISVFDVIFMSRIVLADLYPSGV